MTADEIEEELRYRIETDKRHFNGVLPERYAIAWHGYLAGIFEWGLINIPHYDRLCSLLPAISDPNPIVDIFAGREEA